MTKQTPLKQRLCASLVDYVVLGIYSSGQSFKSNELVPAQVLGLKVFGSEPAQRGFSQPCSLWEGQCTIHASSHYPHACRTYKCKLLKEVLDENTPLSVALTVVQHTKEMIKDVEALLPVSSNNNFRERLVAHIDLLKGKGQRNVDLRAGELLTVFEKQFGVKGLVDWLE